MSAGKLIRTAAVAYLGYLFWTAYDQQRRDNLRRRGNLENTIPNLQGGVTWYPDGTDYAGVTSTSYGD